MIPTQFKALTILHQANKESKEKNKERHENKLIASFR